MAEFHCDQVAPFEIDLISLELLSDHGPVRDLARKPRLPEALEELWRGLLAHESYNIGCGDCSGIGETIQERSYAKEMVAVTVCDIDSCQVLAACRDPIH